MAFESAPPGGLAKSLWVMGWLNIISQPGYEPGGYLLVDWVNQKGLRSPGEKVS